MNDDFDRDGLIASLEILAREFVGLVAHARSTSPKQILSHRMAV